MASESFCPSCGEVLPVLERKDEVIRDQAEQMAYLRGQLRKERNAKARAPEASPFYDDAKVVFEYWRKRLSPRAREFTDERLEKVVARLRAGYTAEELCRAVDGVAARPYVRDGKRLAHGNKSERHTELAMICRSESHVLRFMSYADDTPTATALEGSDKDLGSIVSADVIERQRAAIDRPAVIARLEELRGWTRDAIMDLGLGLDGDRVTFPVRDADGRMVGLHRYQPNPDRRGTAPKQIANGKRDLFPAPEELETRTCWLAEGEPDAVALVSNGIPAVGVPGVATWKDGWAERFARFDVVYIVFDCDDEGRDAAEARSKDLSDHTQVQIVDLDPTRDDHYDVTDFCLDNAGTVPSQLSRLTVRRSGGGIVVRMPDRYATPPFDLVTDRLEEHGCRVQHRGNGHATAQCPNHDDRDPSLSVSEGDDGRVLFKCHAGCTNEDICKALDLELRDLFAA